MAWAWLQRRAEGHSEVGGKITTYLFPSPHRYEQHNDEMMTKPLQRTSLQNCEECCLVLHEELVRNGKFQDVKVIVEFNHIQISINTSQTPRLVVVHAPVFVFNSDVNGASQVPVSCSSCSVILSVVWFEH